MKKINKVVLLIFIPFFIVACSISFEYVAPTDPDVSGFESYMTDFELIFDQICKYGAQKQGLMAYFAFK